MSCYFPLNGFIPVGGGKLMATERGDCRPVTVPCGYCIGCKLERSRQWAVRCHHESMMHSFSSFVTLTYSDSCLPFRSSLQYRDFQLFIDRLRKRLKCSVRFYMSGEYGDVTRRPHYHACLFGVFFADRVYYRKSPAGFTLYRSDMLDSCWGKGLCSIGDVTLESAGYCARYICKKVSSSLDEDHYKRIDPETGEVYELFPEFSRMSLRPGIGATWFAKYADDVFPQDFAVVDGAKCQVPRYYKDLLARRDKFMVDDVSFARSVAAAHPERVADQTPERLVVREVCARARLSLKTRSLE